jgi:YidC/Oxa1 family membrane protein insertase
MDPFSFAPIAATLDAAYAALMALAEVLQPFAGPASAAVAVILLTLTVRALLIPVGISQAKAEQTRARLAPQLQALQRRHRNDRERLQRETMKLYADEKASPFAGCLPIAIQAPVVGVIYALFLHASIAGHPNDLLTHELFGVPLGQSLAGLVGHGTLDAPAGAVFGILIVAIAVVAEVTRRVLRPHARPDGAPAGALRLAGVLQFATAVWAMFVPLAAGLYLLVTVTWTLVQRLVLRRRYPLPPLPTAGGAAP